MKFKTLSLFMFFFVLWHVTTMRVEPLINNDPNDSKAVESLKNNKNKPPLPNLPLQVNTLKNPSRLFKINKESSDLIFRARFKWNDSKIYNSEHPSNKFSYKIIKVSSEKITVFYIDQNKKVFNENDVNATNFLTSVLIQNIDLPCNDHTYICTLGEMIKEYKHKLINVDFEIDKQVENDMGDVKAKSNCIVMTIGSFQSLKEIGYICLDTKDDLIFFLNFLSERVMAKVRNGYIGSIRLKDE